jgi:hypothetical protein
VRAGLCACSAGRVKLFAGDLGRPFDQKVVDPKQEALAMGTRTGKLYVL